MINAYILLQRVERNQETELLTLSRVPDIDQLSDPAWPLRRNLVWTEHYPEGPPDLRVLTQHAHQFL
ncbi:hypothetical protein Pan161_61490 [Gimesia algae]|uniref:Uncharacterized protein n=1 Tax=Gimesia algae TaxID=2527971 RepID=A0A517VN84_9PLAN|nr:hypothetical protein Pan161_61490 [Gimesia algae]